MSVKPICIIYIPENLELSGSKNVPMELMKALNGNFGEKVPGNKIIYSDYWKDYYWFAFYDYEIQTPRFEVFHEKDFTEIQFLELKEKIEKSLANMKNIL